MLHRQLCKFRSAYETGVHCNKIEVMRKLTVTAALMLFAFAAQSQDYIFFLHNKYVEDEGLVGVHPEFGRVEYKEILEAFHKKGFVVISELRPKGTGGIEYAHKTAKQVDSLVKTGVNPSHITVIGTSKGGYIAQYASGLLKNNKLNFVFIGSCGDYLDDEPDVKWYGNVLSIYEKSDKWLSCEKMKNRQANNVEHYKEIELNTGMKHGYLYKALPLWIEPSAKWAKQQYK